MLADGLVWLGTSRFQGHSRMASRVDRPTFSDRVPTDPSEGLADRLAEALADGNSVLLTGPADPCPLFAAAARHPRLLRSTVLHVGPPLDLISMLRQVTADDGPRDATLEQGFDRLTAPGAGCERVVLFVAEAHLLPHATLRYIEFALHAGLHLTVVLAGQNGLLDLLALDGFSGLRNRIPVHLVLPDASTAHTDPPARTSVPGSSNLAPAYRMTPPRLLAAAAVTAGLAVMGMISLSPPALPVTAALVEPEAAPSVAAVEPSPESASALAAPVAVAGPVQAPDASTVATQQAPVAAPLSSPATEAEPALTAETAAAAGIVAVNAPDVPSASLSNAEATASPPGAASHADVAGAANAPAQRETAQAGAPGPLTVFTPEAGPEIAEVADAPELNPAVPSELPAAVPDQVEAPETGIVAGPAADASAKPDNTADIAAGLPPSAQLTVPMPLARQAHAGVLPRAPARSTIIRPERVGDRLPAPGGNGQRCRSIILRLQIGETPTDGERAYLRNGCQ